MEKLTIQTTSRESLIEITALIQQVVEKTQIRDGICVIFVPHTTACVTINENADPSVKIDLLTSLAQLIPEKKHYLHIEGNSDSHIKTSITGSSQNVIVENNRLQLGTWQGIFFCEFDGPRTREIWVKLIGTSR